MRVLFVFPLHGVSVGEVEAGQGGDEGVLPLLLRHQGFHHLKLQANLQPSSNERRLRGYVIKLHFKQKLRDLNSLLYHTFFREIAFFNTHE